MAPCFADVFHPTDDPLCPARTHHDRDNGSATAQGGAEPVSPMAEGASNASHKGTPAIVLHRLIGSRAVSALLLAGLAAACGDAADLPTPQRTPNLLLITIDTLRADHLEAYGYHRPTAPFLTRLASSGVRFERAMSQAPWTLPATASIHSSLYPTQHGAFQAETALPDGADTLAEFLQGIGYRTVAVVSHEFVAARHGFAQGFEIFDENNILGHDALTSEGLTLVALGQLEQVGEPWFLWVHYFDPHFTYVRHPEVGFADGYTGALPEQLTSARLGREPKPLDPTDLTYVEAVYDEEITHTDGWIGALWQGIEERYGTDETVIFVTADHGEYFMERGRFFHGKDVYHELVNVPLIIGGALESGLRGRVVSDAVETRSIPRTVLGLLGVPTERFDGVDLLEVARSGGAPAALSEGTYAFGLDGRTVGVEHAGWKLVYRLGNRSYELYDLSSDPLERNDVYGRFRDRVEVMAPLLQKLQSLEELPRLEPQQVGIPGETLERLRALGYLR
jgi:arylsulfatase A-like enzyme